MRFLSNMSAAVVAAVLLFSGLIHAAQPYFFIHTISSYRLLPASASGLLGLILPYLQIVLALCIGLKVAEKIALYTAAFVFAIFATAQMTVLARGLEIDCGCFGFVAHTVSPVSVTLPILLIGACMFAIVGGGHLGAKNQETAKLRDEAMPGSPRIHNRVK